MLVFSVDSEMSKSRKRSSSRGSSRSRSDQRESKQIHLQDCEHLIREEWVSLPGGFTRQGSPLLVFPDKSQFNYLHVTDLHTVLQYYINVVPRSEQVLTASCSNYAFKTVKTFVIRKSLINQSIQVQKIKENPHFRVQVLL